MLIAKLTEPVEKIYQKNGLETETVTAQYLAVSVSNYDMGATLSIFNYKIGKFENQSSSIKPYFNPVIRGSVRLTEQEFADWGTDDTVLLQIVANKLNVEIESIETLKGENFKA